VPCCFLFPTDIALFVFLSIAEIQLQHIRPDFKHCSGIFPSEILQIIL